MLRLENIVSYLKTKSAITNLISTRIFFGEPMREQTGSYLVLNQVAQTVENINTKQALVEFRIIGNDENVRKSQLITIMEAITSELVTTSTNQAYIDEVYKIVEGGSFELFVDDKNRNLLIFDLIFYYIS